MLNIGTLILQIGIIVLAARLVGFIFRKLHQPEVMGEILAGIMLGPSLLGWLAPAMSEVLFPIGSLGYLNALSQVGLLVFMFLVGLTLNPKELRDQGELAVFMSHCSIVVPFVLGALTALYLYPRLSDDSVTFTSFALFMGAATSVTAFPVLARILKERNLTRSRVGTLTIACAAVDDVTAWCILAYIVVLVRATASATPLWLSVTSLAIYILVMVFAVRRLLRWWHASYYAQGRVTDNMIALILLLVFASALLTEYMGIHTLFGAFLVGAIMPKDPLLIRHLIEKFESITVVLLLPLFFAFTGLRTSIGLVHGAEMWFYCAIILLVAIAGKLGGSMLSGRVAGMQWRDAAVVGLLLNTRGLMELVILNIGLDIHVISPALFSMMVLMALVTTFMTTPLLELIYPPARLNREASRNASEQQVKSRNIA
jgi:Kef-type K+ transport system membrane component KefB